MNELLNAKSILMQSRWRVSGNADRAQDVLDIILLALPASPSDELDTPLDKSDSLGVAWNSIMDELEQILQQLSASNFLSNREDFRSNLQISELLNTDVAISSKDEIQGEISRSTDRDLLVNFTIDILLLVEISKHAEITFTMLARLLKQVLTIPEDRFTIVLYALKEISEG